MNRAARLIRRRSPRRPGISLIEASVATLIVGVLFISAMESVRHAHVAQAIISDQATGSWLADALVDEILGCVFEDDQVSGTLGVESGETGNNRSRFDDVDDYRNYSDSPPQSKSGQVYSELAKWRRDVRVEWVTTPDSSTTSSTATEVKRITVTTTHDGKRIASRIAIKVNLP